MTGSGNSQGSYDNALWVAPDSADTIIVGGIDLYRSTDGGTTLTRISTWQNYDDGTSAHADQHIIVPHPDYTANNPIVYVGNDGGIQRNDNVLDLVGNVRNSWVNLANGLGVTQFYTGAASPLGTVFLGGTQDNSVLRYIEGDGTDEWYQGFTGDGGYCAVVGSSIMYSATQYLCIRKSTDGGNSWTVSVNGLTDVDTDGDGQCGPNSLAAFVAPFILDPNDNQTLLAGAVNLWATSDAAANWTQIRTPLASTAQCSALAIAETNSLRAWAGYTDGTVSYTPVNLLNWVDVDDGITPIPELPITDIAISPINADEVFVTIGGQQSNSVWYTQDSGITWEQRTGSGQTALPAIQVNTITFHPEKPSWVYVGTDIGIFASEDKGLTWNKTPRFGDVGTDGPVYTEVDDLFWYAGSGGAMLVAATHGRGMFRVRPLGTVYVDWRNAGDPDENGTLAHPFNRVVEGHDVAGGGTTISIASGQYEEDNPLVLYKAVTLEATGGSVVIR